MRVAYVTGLGVDGMSAEMLASWEREGIDTSCVQRLADRLPGIYMIETDPGGERRFHYWRKDSAARHWLEAPEAGKVLVQLAAARMVYLSGISLAILSPADRELLIAALAQCRARGGSVVFDNNYRPRLWESRGHGARGLPARAGPFRHRAAHAGRRTGAVRPGRRACRHRTHPRLGVGEVVVKCGGEPCVVWADGELHEVAPEPVADVVDTTAAGDSFGAAYMAARLSGQGPEDAARAGHRLAGTVIRHRGAIIPREAMPALSGQPSSVSGPPRRRVSLNFQP